MSWFTQALSSSIGRKLVMASTGLFLVSFLLVHLTGNLQLFANDGGEAFNKYTYFMTHNGLIKILEYVLAAGFLLHIIIAYVLAARNKAARPVGYVKQERNKKVSWSSVQSLLSGSIVLVFLILHLINFWVKIHFDGGVPMVTIEGKEVINAYAITQATFQNPVLSLFYVLAMVLLFFHLNHGFQSAFRTFGLDHKKYTPLVNGVGTIISIVIPALFAAMPLYFWLGLANN